MSAKRYDVVGLRAVFCALPRLNTLWRVTVRALATYWCYPAWLLYYALWGDACGLKRNAGPGLWVPCARLSCWR